MLCQKTAVLIPLYKGKGEMTECSNYRAISLLNLVTEALTDDERGSFRVGKGCVDQIFTLKQIVEKGWVKKCKVYVGFIHVEKAYAENV